MMLTCVGLLLGFVTPSQGEQPKGAAPQVMTAQVDKMGRAFVVSTVYKSVPVTVQVKVQVNGREEIRQQTVYQMVVEKSEIFLDSTGVDIYGIDGKRLDAKTLKLRGPTPVLVSSDGNPIDPFYARVAREGTLMIVSPRLARFGQPIILPTPPKGEEIKAPEKK